MQIRGKTIPTLWLGGAAVVALLVLIGVVAWQSGPVLGQSFSIGYVDMQRALDNQLQQQFVQKREELLSGLDKDIRAAVEKVGRDRGVSIVLDRTVVLYGGMDLTDAVIAQLAAK